LEFTEWQAYYQLEPFGEQITDLRHGVAVSVLANVNRNHEAKPEPFTPSDFIHWGDLHQEEEVEPVLLDDPVAQSNLMRAALFGKAPI
jgi:hypothetical protein